MLIKKIVVGRMWSVDGKNPLKLELEAELESFDSAESAATILYSKLELMKSNILDKDIEWLDEFTTSSGR